mgnify:CR=1 FL=1
MALWFALPLALLMPSLAYAYGWSQFLRVVDVRYELAADFADQFELRSARTFDKSGAVRGTAVADGRLTGIISIGDVVKNRIGELEFERDQLDHYVHQT